MSSLLQIVRGTMTKLADGYVVTMQLVVNTLLHCHCMVTNQELAVYFDVKK